MEERTLQLQPHQGPGGTTITEKPPSSPAALLFSDEDSDDDGESAEFEFPSVSRDSPAGTAAPADELFADGRIRPLYYPAKAASVVSLGAGSTGSFAAQHHQPAAAPQRVRGQLGRLFLEESCARGSSSSSVSSEEESDDDDGGGGLDGAPPESYCLWTPAAAGSSSSPRAPSRRKRSSSTGSSVARWRRISELVVGRSRSDGKDRFTFFLFPAHAQGEPAAADGKRRHDDKIKQMPPSTPKQAAAKVGKRPSSTATGGRKLAPSPANAEVDSAHRVGMAYGATPRRTFLPYREELVGFFANVNGISRSHHHLTF